MDEYSKIIGVAYINDDIIDIYSLEHLDIVDKYWRSLGVEPEYHIDEDQEDHQG
jgi:hypothetical protein